MDEYTYSLRVLELRGLDFWVCGLGVPLYDIQSLDSRPSGDIGATCSGESLALPIGPEVDPFWDYLIGFLL